MPLQGATVEEVFELIQRIDHAAEGYKLWGMVKSQAVVHTRAVPPVDLLESLRPNESEFIRQYRIDNYRAFTNEGFVKFNDKAARIINSSQFTIINESEDLRQWINTTGFDAGNGSIIGFNEYFSHVVLPCSFEDPNALLVAFPFNPNNPDIPPSFPEMEGGFPENETISIKTKIIPSENLVYVSKNVFSWLADYLWLIESESTDKSPVFAPFFFICDQVNYYRAIPVKVNTDKNTKFAQPYIYELQLWYRHDTGVADETQLPINILGGTLTKDPDNEGFAYYESFMKPYFEFGDEFINAYSDFQAVRVTQAYPKKVMTDIPCSDCRGQGKRKYQDREGVYYTDTCQTCGGNGVQKDIGPFDTLVVPDKSNLTNEGSSRDPLTYVSPDISALQFVNQDAWAIYGRMLESVNLDLLINMSESGEAMKERKDDLLDMLMKIGANLFGVMQRHLWYVECLLHPIRSEREIPVIVEPTSYQVKTEAMLLQDVQNAHLSNKVTALMELNKKLYAGNKELIRIKELALKFSPLLAIEDVNQINSRIAAGAYTANDVIKRDRAEMIMEQVAAEFGERIFDNAQLQAIFDRANQILDPFLIEATPPLFP